METGPYRRSAPPPSRGLTCPRCRDTSKLVCAYVADVELDECPSCRGQWLDREVFSSLVMDERRQRKVVERARLAQALLIDSHGLDCPRCGDEMTRKNFSRTSGIHIDVCVKHGVWLDDGELRDIADYLHRDADSLSIAPARKAPKLPDIETIEDIVVGDADLTSAPTSPPTPPGRARPEAETDREFAIETDDDTKTTVAGAILFVGYIALRLAIGF